MDFQCLRYSVWRLLLLGGRLSDLFGARKNIYVGFAILTSASLLAGVAWSESTLNLGRALQGLGSAFIAPAALTLVLSKFTDPKELNKALGFWEPLLLQEVQQEFF